MRSVFPGYSDAEKVGEGGLGNVYRAIRESTGGVVAIKELHDVGVGSPMWHRARRELDALLRLKGHPNVVSVEEIIEGSRGPCLVMEFAPGGSLADRVAGGPLSGSEVVLVGQHVTRALQSAHDLGIVHRDVKPHNLLVGSFGQVKVCDFGIAALTRGAEGRTQTKAMTLAYASPEELDGVDEVGPPADVFSFGATMLHLATGRRPSFQDRFDANAGDGKGIGSEALSVSGVEAAIWKCLRADPGFRPTMSELRRVFDDAAAALGTKRLDELSTQTRSRVESNSAGAQGEEAASRAVLPAEQLVSCQLDSVGNSVLVRSAQ